jgi:hypothetical protein
MLVVFRPTPLKKHGVSEFVSWDYDIPNCLWKNNPNVPNHKPAQPVMAFNGIQCGCIAG